MDIYELALRIFGRPGDKLSEQMTFKEIELMIEFEHGAEEPQDYDAEAEKREASKIAPRDAFLPDRNMGGQQIWVAGHYALFIDNVANKLSEILDDYTTQHTNWIVSRERPLLVTLNELVTICRKVRGG